MIACQALLSTEFSRQEYSGELPLPSPGVLPNRGIELVSPALRADSLSLSHLGSPIILNYVINKHLLSTYYVDPEPSAFMSILSYHTPYLKKLSE